MEVTSRYILKPVAQSSNFNLLKKCDLIHRRVMNYCENATQNYVPSNRIPFPEEPTTCCRSGCNNCIWLDYAQKLTDYYKDGGEKAIEEIKIRITDESIKAYLLHELKMQQKKS